MRRRDTTWFRLGNSAADVGSNEIRLKCDYTPSATRRLELPGSNFKANKTRDRDRVGVSTTGPIEKLKRRQYAYGK